MSMPVGGHLTTKEVSRRLKISVARISQLVAEGRLSVAQRAGTMMFFDPNEVARFAQIPRKTGAPKKEKNNSDRRQKIA